MPGNGEDESRDAGQRSRSELSDHSYRSELTKRHESGHRSDHSWRSQDRRESSSRHDSLSENRSHRSDRSDREYHHSHKHHNQESRDRHREHGRSRDEDRERDRRRHRHSRDGESSKRHERHENDRRDKNKRTHERESGDHGKDTSIKSSQSTSSLSKKPRVEESTEDGDWVVAEDTGNFYSKPDFVTKNSSHDPVDSITSTPITENTESPVAFTSSREQTQTPRATTTDDIASVSPDDGEISDMPEPSQPPPVSIAAATLPTVNDLNKLKAAILKAELQGNTSKVEDLKKEYDELSKRVLPATSEVDNISDGIDNSNKPAAIDIRFNRIPASKLTNSADPSVQDMLREEINSRDDRLDLKMAEQISRDGGYINDLDYMDDNVEKLATIAQKSEQNLRNQMIEKTRRLNESISECRLCLEEGGSSGTTIISIATQVYLCVAPEPAIVKGTVAIVPMDHYTNTLECSDDEWEEIRNFMKSLTQMWHKKRKGVLFYENAVNRSGRLHASIFAVPVPFHLLDSAPGFFQESIIALSDEWSSHRHIIDTRKPTTATQNVDPKYLFRTSIAKQAPYFHVWFNINGGIGHIVEDTAHWPKGDRFARDVIGGMLRLDPVLIRQSTKWIKGSSERDFIDELWHDFDWTLAIAR
ncbi:hypothetical protein AWJ20_5082 [Sugiyamaella lignohabitans]|uniref:Uncharacterized protein n=1 Tax=Sugiyamaella lignohabitans TaxID=796027 RepID=A0A167EIJ2_9ASCO|nr:uncharacterized protein AWJ20_5082 [Sugiyamaella lignohabitans]ANB14124.1 hypothetical protein AWJ20_5082 [Sugiyamaella lignohabitans]